MAATPSDPEGYRRQQRRRAWIGWIGSLLVIALIVLGGVLGGGSDDSGGEVEEAVEVPYGETMSSAQYDRIEEGESRVDVLRRLDKTGRPESLTEGYVLVLFPPKSESVNCSYWEFTDEPEIFARLCFDNSDGDLVQKLKHDVHGVAGGSEGNVV